MFAYGSGFAATMFRLHVNVSMTKNPEIIDQLSRRIKLNPEEYTRRMQVREQDYQRKDYVTTDNLQELRPGTVYLEKVDNKWRRFYKRKENNPRI